MSRLLFAAAFVASSALGCERREADDPSDFIAAETARAAYAERARTRARAIGRCDEGGRRVVAPEDLAGEGGDAEADLTFADDAPRPRLRGTVSLGFIGDGKLTYVPRGHVDTGGFSYPGWTSRGFGPTQRGSGGRSGVRGGSPGGGGGGHGAPR